MLWVPVLEQDMEILAVNELQLKTSLICIDVGILTIILSPL
jgi:hypothetical protein